MRFEDPLLTQDQIDGPVQRPDETSIARAGRPRNQVASVGRDVERFLSCSATIMPMLTLYAETLRLGDGSRPIATAWTHHYRFAG